MKIVSDIYKAMLETPLPVPPETGGILGMKENEIVKIAFDKNENVYDRAVYAPNIVYLNKIISEWENCGIELCGIFHTHLSGSETLSSDDIKAIENIMSSMPEKVKQMYFPVVIPTENIFVYLAERTETGIEIKADNFILSGGEINEKKD